MGGSTKSNTALHVEESITLLDIVSHKLRQLKDEVVNTDD